MIDFEIAKLEGLKAKTVNDKCFTVHTGRGYSVTPYSPSTDWAQGGPLIEKYGVSLRLDNGGWIASIGSCHYFDEHALMAVVRVICLWGNIDV